ncbi:MAG: hypothetical protein K6T85_03260 [Gorillibacterium sp.]|nr:hypothetical protein [Gorillibacterium sp.]
MSNKTKRMLSNVLVAILLLTLLTSAFPAPVNADLVQAAIPGNTAAPGQLQEPSEQPPVSGTEENGPKLTTSWLSQQYQKSEAWVTAQLNAGYTLLEVKQALDLEGTGLPYELALEKINPTVKEQQNELSRLLKQTLNYQSTVTMDTYASVITGTHGLTVMDNTYGLTVTDSTYMMRTMQAAAERPSTYDETVLTRLGTRESQAPYSVSSNVESVSTLSGDLNLHYNELTLPGRNGLSFSLVRQYNASDSNFYEKNVQVVPIYTMAFLPKLFYSVYFGPYGTEKAPGGEAYMVDAFTYN